MSKFIEQIKVEIPRFQRGYVLKSDANPIYYKKGMKLPPSYNKRITKGNYIWKTRNGSLTLWHVKDKKFILKNTKTVGKPKIWPLNGQNFCSLHWRIKDEVTNYYKRYFSGYIVQQIDTIPDMENRTVSIACDIHEEQHKDLPDIDNLAWIIRKWFTDTLHENDIIPDDDHRYIMEAGKTKYIFVDKPEDRKLIFKINIYGEE